MTVIRCIDFETTGVPSPTERHAIVEAGWCDLAFNEDHGTISEPVSMLVNPGRAIPPEASAVHHIVDRDVAGAPPQAEALAKIGDGVAVWCAHNADFEKEFIGVKPLVCTFKAALRIFPDVTSHALQVLRYALKFDDLPDFEIGWCADAHRAGADAYLAAVLLRELLGKASLGDIERWSRGPALLVTVTFGKHAGMKWKDLPTDYLKWVAENIDDDRNKRATAKYYLKQRGEAT